MEHAGFWRRTVSLFADTAVLAPLIALHLTVGYSSPLALGISSILTAVINAVYPVFFLSRWGQTPGKMLARIKVTRLDGSPISTAQAWLRSLVDMALVGVWVIGTLSALANWSGEWASLSRGELLKAISAANPLDRFYQVAIQVWYWGELVVLLTNKRRRSLHDFIAGTVVIRQR